jgi:hypothetical protein
VNCCRQRSGRDPSTAVTAADGAPDAPGGGGHGHVGDSERGDGWIQLAYPPGEEGKAAIATLRRSAEKAGRDPATIGLDTRVSAGAGAEAEWREEVRLWKSLGVTT